MAKIVFVNIPAHGHTNPTLAITHALVERGHEVVYYSGEEMRGLIERTGADFRAYPEPMPTAKEVTDALNELLDATLLLIKISEAHTAWFIAEMRREKPQVILYDSTAQWGYVAARSLGIPHICSICTFVLEGSQNHLPKAALLRFLLQAIPKLPRILRWKQFMVKQFGAANVGGITEFSECNLVYTSRELHPENSTLDERFHFVGPSLDSRQRSVTVPVDTRGEEQLVFISLGTIVRPTDAFCEAVFSAFKDFPAQFVFSVGKQTEIARLGTIPANFTVRNEVPQLEILERAAAFITHGGMNSVHEGLVYGVPEIVIPHQMEQLLNGLRVAQVGAGLLLGERPPYGRVTAPQLRVALEKVLTEPSFKHQAAYFGETLKAAGGYPQAVNEIERYLSSVML